MIGNNNYDVIIAGGGPAGSSAATFLAMRGARVLLVEQKKFPRPKLCGEFISPECANLFARLGVAEQMFAAHPATVSETVFYSRNGKSVRVPSSWFESSSGALGLSRAEMDERLLRRARAAGVEVLENAHATNLRWKDEIVSGITIKHEGKEETFQSPIVIDATGRTRALVRRVAPKANSNTDRRPSMIAFKAHLEDTRVAPGACEIYFYRGGYGGLSSIENGLSNLCFIATARDVHACDADAGRVVREIVRQNARANEALATARIASPWLAVALEGFGRHNVAPAKGLLAIGDAASFIDPFTGSGMLMALQSGELAAASAANYLNSHPGSRTLTDLAAKYRADYKNTLDSRLRICSLLRKAAFVPRLAELAITMFAASDRLRHRLARATRGAARETYYSS